MNAYKRSIYIYSYQYMICLSCKGVVAMKYENAEDVLPSPLLKQLQKYVSGKVLYVPAKDKKRSWGETSGYKKYLVERNSDIKAKFKSGESIEALANEYYLSCESIKKIVYSKKEVKLMQYECSLSSAQGFAENGKLEEWVHSYLLSDGHNKDFSDGLKLYDRYFLGPMKMPLSLFRRCCGPEENMKYRVNAQWFENQVSKLSSVIQTHKDMPPLIVHFVEGEFELNDGNHRHEAYSRLGIEAYYVIVWITEKQELEMFKSIYSAYIG